MPSMVVVGPLLRRQPCDPRHAARRHEPFACGTATRQRACHDSISQTSASRCWADTIETRQVECAPAAANKSDGMQVSPRSVPHIQGQRTLSDAAIGLSGQVVARGANRRNAGALIEVSHHQGQLYIRDILKRRAKGAASAAVARASPTIATIFNDSEQIIFVLAISQTHHRLYTV